MRAKYTFDKNTIFKDGHTMFTQDVVTELNEASRQREIKRSPLQIETSVSSANVGDGYEKLWCWFGLSRASWLTIPRVLLHAMPEDWQLKLTKLLEEYEQTFPNQPNIGTRVQVTDMGGKLIKTPGWMLNYKHPNQQEIDKLKAHKETS